MKHISLFIYFFLLACFSISAQNHDWQWAKTEIQPNHPNTTAFVYAVATDPDGNALETGLFFTDSIQFGTYTLYNSDPTENTSDIFIVKYDPSGNVLWAKSAGGSSNDIGNAIATDKSGNVYITGGFYSDSLLSGSNTIYNSGPTDTTDDIVVIKYSSAGNVLWAKSFGGDYYDAALGVATDQSGNVFFGGFFRSDSISIGSYRFYDATGRQRDNSFLVKCDSSGNIKWAANSQSQSWVETDAVCTDPSGNAFITGRFTATTASFGSQTIQNYTVGWNDIFLVKYDTAGNVLWAQDAGGSLDDQAYGVAADAHGNSYITGYFNSVNAYFGADQLNNDTTNGSADIFITKYDPNGNELWTNSAGGDLNDIGWAIATDTASNVYITGFYYSPTLISGNDTILNYNAFGNIDDIFINEYNQNGSLLSTIDVGGDSYDAAFGIATDVSQNVYIGGFYRSDNIYFGTNRLDNSTATHNQNSFVAKYASTPLGINNLHLLPTISLYPNPANDRIIAQSQSFSATGAVSAAIYDVTGHVMDVSQYLSAGKITFNTSALAAGMYLIRFTVDGREANAKFVKVADGQ